MRLDTKYRPVSVPRIMTGKILLAGPVAGILLWGICAATTGGVLVVVGLLIGGADSGLG